MMKLQKIMIDAGFTCPNRDGSKGLGGCSFCRTDAFSPSYCKGSIALQIQKGKAFFRDKYPQMQYLAYFQSYSNTYAPLEVLRERYEEALGVKDVVGLVIGTRPDCLPTEVLDYLKMLSERTRLQVEVGVESLLDRTLERVNRCHSAADSISAIKALHERGLSVTVHMILGLPGESREDILCQADMLSKLPVGSVKLHQMQILRGTRMEQEYLQHPEDFLDLSAEEYVRLVVDYTRRLGEGIRVERYASSSPRHLLIHPSWGLKPSQIEQMVRQESQIR